MSEDTSPVPEKTIFNQYGQKIRVRVIAGRVLVHHEAMDGLGFFEYIPPETPTALPAAEETFASETPPPLFREPRQEREFLEHAVPEASPQSNLTIEEKHLIEAAAASLVLGTDAPSGWFSE